MKRYQGICIHTCTTGTYVGVGVCVRVWVYMFVYTLLQYIIIALTNYNDYYITLLIYINFTSRVVNGIPIIRGAATGGTGDMSPPPTLKSRGTSYLLIPLLLPQHLF